MDGNTRVRKKACGEYFFLDYSIQNYTSTFSDLRGLPSIILPILRMWRSVLANVFPLASKCGITCASIVINYIWYNINRYIML